MFAMLLHHNKITDTSYPRRQLWLSNSPDLKLVDYSVWGILLKKVTKMHRWMFTLAQMLGVDYRRQMMEMGWEQQILCYK